MPCNGEIIKDAVEQFQKVQAHMKNARKENAAFKQWQRLGYFVLSCWP